MYGLTSVSTSAVPLAIQGGDVGLGGVISHFRNGARFSAGMFGGSYRRNRSSWHSPITVVSAVIRAWSASGAEIARCHP